MNWAQAELSGAELGDKRLTRRLVKLAYRFSEKPMASIPEASLGWPETRGAYRFFSNGSVSWEKILLPHWQQSVLRMQVHQVVLCVQDTTELNFNGQEMAGLGPLSYESQRGMYLHPTYAMTVDREPLGVLDAWMWSREFKDADGVRSGIVESTRWIEGYERLAELAPTMPDTRLVYVADREADIAALLAKARDLGEPVDYLIRASHNRSLDQGELLWHKVESRVSLGEIRFTLPKRPNTPPREVRQAVFAQRVTFKDGQRGQIEATCIVAREFHAPQGAKPVIWRLLTNRCVQTLADAVELIKWYSARWEIEMFFHILKNGCRVEALQLASQARVERALALYMIVAWRIAHLMRLGRTCPDLDAELYFDPIEWKMAFILLNKPVPDKPPTLNTVIRTIAQLGGFLARQSDGEPGAKTLWQGLRCLYQSLFTLDQVKKWGMP
jgi:hypothetical protein